VGRGYVQVRVTTRRNASAHDCTRVHPEWSPGADEAGRQQTKGRCYATFNQEKISQRAQRNGWTCVEKTESDEFEHHCGEYANYRFISERGEPLKAQISYRFRDPHVDDLVDEDCEDWTVLIFSDDRTGTAGKMIYDEHALTQKEVTALTKEALGNFQCDE